MWEIDESIGLQEGFCLEYKTAQDEKHSHNQLICFQRQKATSI